jgi:hypothetical protein
MGHLKITNRFGNGRWLDFEPYTPEDFVWQRRGPDASLASKLSTVVFAEHPNLDVLLELGREQPMVCGFHAPHNNDDLYDVSRPLAHVETVWDYRGISKTNTKAREARDAKAAEEHAAKVNVDKLRAEATAKYNETIGRIVHRVNAEFAERIARACSEGEREWARERDTKQLDMLEAEIEIVQAELAGVRKRLSSLRDRRHATLNALAHAALERGGWEVGEGAPLPEPVREAVRAALDKPRKRSPFGD